MSVGDTRRLTSGGAHDHGTGPRRPRSPLHPRGQRLRRPPAIGRHTHRSNAGGLQHPVALAQAFPEGMAGEGPSNIRCAPDLDPLSLPVRTAQKSVLGLPLGLWWFRKFHTLAAGRWKTGLLLRSRAVRTAALGAGLLRCAEMIPARPCPRAKRHIGSRPPSRRWPRGVPSEGANPLPGAGFVRGTPFAFSGVRLSHP